MNCGLHPDAPALAVCVDCGKIEEFHEPQIEELQERVCVEKGWVLKHHNLRLFGTCRACTRAAEKELDDDESRVGAR